MTGVTSYDDDFYAWAHEQAAALRRLVETRRDLPNELDIDNIAEEMEGVARTELRSAESFLRLLLLHVLKVVSAPDARSVNHWRAEALGFQSSLALTMGRTIRRKMNVDKLWLIARKQAEAQLHLEGDELLPNLPDRFPLDLDDLSAETFDLVAARGALAASATPPA